MGAWDLEVRIEKLREKMIESALRLGIGHPCVYELSVELDKLHNEWQKSCQQAKFDRIYVYPKQIKQAKETADEIYRTVV
jgi:hypothetical protein